jgi:hypothetical protein
MHEFIVPRHAVPRDAGIADRGSSTLPWRARPRSVASWRGSVAPAVEKLKIDAVGGVNGREGRAGELNVHRARDSNGKKCHLPGCP